MTEAKYKDLTEIDKQIKKLEESASGSVSAEAVKELESWLTQARKVLDQLEFRYHMLLHHRGEKKVRSERRLTELMDKLRTYGFSIRNKKRS